MNKGGTKMELIERYIYAVTQRLPQSQQNDIAQELRGLIEDMLEAKVGDREITKKEVEEVLFELGNPVNLAAKYRGSKRYLISPEVFEPYLIILKIVMFSIVIAMTTVFVIETIIDPNALLAHFIDFIVSLINVSTQAFAWITIGFGIVEYFGAFPTELKNSRHNRWNPANLPAIPDRKKKIKRVDAVAGIIFSILTLVFIIFSNHLFGVPIFENQKLVKIVPFLNIEIFAEFLPIIYLIVGVGILKDCLKLVSGKWTKKLAFNNLILNIVTLGLVAMLLQNPSILNPNFIQELSQLGVLNPETDASSIVREIWDNASIWVVVIFAFSVIVDSIASFYKAYNR
jgi:hypothetical protein